MILKYSNICWPIFKRRIVFLKYIPIEKNKKENSIKTKKVNAWNYI